MIPELTLRMWLMRQLSEASGDYKDHDNTSRDEGYFAGKMEGYRSTLSFMNSETPSLWSPDLPTAEGWYWFRGKIFHYETEVGTYMIHILVYPVSPTTYITDWGVKIYDGELNGSFRGQWLKVEEPE